MSLAAAFLCAADIAFAGVSVTLRTGEVLSGDVSVADEDVARVDSGSKVTFVPWIAIDKVARASEDGTPVVSDEDDERTATLLYGEGKRNYRSGDHRQALNCFMRVHALVPDDVTVMGWVRTCKRAIARSAADNSSPGSGIVPRFSGESITLDDILKMAAIASGEPVILLMDDIRKNYFVNSVPGTKIKVVIKTTMQSAMPVDEFMEKMLGAGGFAFRRENGHIEVLTK